MRKRAFVRFTSNCCAGHGSISRERNSGKTGTIRRDQLHAEIHEIVAGTKPGRERAEERILVHTTGLASQDIVICHYIFEQAKGQGLGITLPAARAMDEP